MQGKEAAYPMLHKREQTAAQRIIKLWFFYYVRGSHLFLLEAHELMFFSRGTHKAGSQGFCYLKRL